MLLVITAGMTQIRPRAKNPPGAAALSYRDSQAEVAHEAGPEFPP